MNAKQDQGSGEPSEETPEKKIGLDAMGLKDFIKSTFLEEPVSEEKPSEEAEPEKDETEEEEPKEVVEEPEEDTSSLTKGVQKRINKLVAAKKAAQAELEAQKAELLNLKKELETVKKPQGNKEAKLSDDIARIESLDDVRSEYKKAVEILLWCDENPDGGTMPNDKGEPVEYSAEDVKLIKRFTNRRKEIELPERARFLQNQEAVDADIVKTFPWLNKPETEEYHWAQMVLNDFPEIKQRRADWKHFAGLVVLGIKAYNEQVNGKKTQQPIKKAPPQPGVTKATPSVSLGADIGKEKENFAKNRDKDGLTNLIKKMGFV